MTMAPIASESTGSRRSPVALQSQTTLKPLGDSAIHFDWESVEAEIPESPRMRHAEVEKLDEEYAETGSWDMTRLSLDEEDIRKPHSSEIWNRLKWRRLSNEVFRSEAPNARESIYPRTKDMTYERMLFAPPSEPDSAVELPEVCFRPTHSHLSLPEIEREGSRSHRICSEEIPAVDRHTRKHECDAMGNIVCTLVVPLGDAETRDACLVFSLQYEHFLWDVERNMQKLRTLVVSLEKFALHHPLKPHRLKKLVELHQIVNEFSHWAAMDLTTRSHAVLRISQIMAWLLIDKVFCKSKPLLVFIEVSWLSFSHNRSRKYQEGFILKVPGGRHYTKGAFFEWLKCIKRCTYQERWLLILDDALCYTDNNGPKMKIRSVLWFDCKTKVMAGLAEAGRTKGLIVQNQSRTLQMEARSESEALQWKGAIEEALHHSMAGKRYRFNSFAPEREAEVRLLVDAQSYFDALYEVLEHAASSIYISGWWITPTILLRRCGTSEDSLMAILKRKAEKGVIVRITVFKEIEAVMYNASKMAMDMLSGTHKNVQVQRHPDHSLVSLGNKRGVLYWSHHEKLVCVDNEICFLGGIDLCLGRYDNHHHTLHDNTSRVVFPGKDYSNPVKKDFQDVKKVNDDLLDRNTDPRMPWHDVQCMIISKEFARDAAKHFMQLWNHILTDKNKAKLPDHAYLTLPPRANVLRTVSRQSTAKFQTMRHRIVTYFGSDRHSFPSSPPALRSSRSSESLPELSERPSQLPPIRESSGSSLSGGHRDLKRTITVAVGRAKDAMRGLFVHPPIPDGKPEKILPFSQTPSFSGCNVQFCRSSAKWNNGLETDSSIHNAYVTLIRQAEHYVYIENQFFITSTHRGADHLDIKNRIGEALVAKIEEKHAKQEPFKVYVVMPLLPAFEAEQFDEEKAWQCRQTMYAQYCSMIDSPDSVIGALEASLSNPTDWENYVVFCCLRQVDAMPDGVVHATQVYVHSKCAIIDDKHVILGSANINDRSMLGSRDSEIAVVISDPTFAKSTRMRLWCEHFDVLDHPSKKIYNVLNNPTSDQCWSWWIKSASVAETMLFEKLHTWPSSEIRYWDDYHGAVMRRRKQIQQLSSTDWQEVLAQIRYTLKGSRVVMYPLFFLNKEDMRYPRPFESKLLSLRVFT